MIFWPWMKSAPKSADGFTAPTVRAVLQSAVGVPARLLYVAGIELNCLETENAVLRDKASAVGVTRLETECATLKQRVLDLEAQLKMLDTEP